MSEQRTEQASQQRKQKARSQGDIVRSRELLSAVALLAGMLTLGVMSSRFLDAWRDIYSQIIRLSIETPTDFDRFVRTAVCRMLAPALLPIGAVLAASFFGALLAGIAQTGGLSLYPETLRFRLERLNPVTNFGHLFSFRSAVRFFKSLLPATVMVMFGWNALKSLMLSMSVMSQARLPMALNTAYALALKAAWLLLVWSGLDYAMEWRSWNERLKTTKQEVRQEMKEAMGNPEIKGKIRQIQRAMRRRKIKADMTLASVVITNPTHYAIALEFSFDTMQAPKVLCKGRDLQAADIREEARWAGIPLIENPPLARSLYKTTEPGQVIPYELYAAVAGILAFLYRQKVEEKMRQEQRRKVQLEGMKAAPILPQIHNFGGGL